MGVPFAITPASASISAPASRSSFRQVDVVVARRPVQGRLPDRFDLPVLKSRVHVGARVDDQPGHLNALWLVPRIVRDRMKQRPVVILRPESRQVRMDLDQRLQPFDIALLNSLTRLLDRRHSLPSKLWFRGSLIASGRFRPLPFCRQ